MPGKPAKSRRKRKDEPKKFGKLSKKGAKMTCSKCKQIGHNKKVCARYGRGSTSQSAPSNDNQKNSTQSSQASCVCGDTTAVPTETQTRPRMGQSSTRTSQSSEASSICSDTAAMPRGPQKKVQDGSGSRLGRKKANARGTPFASERDNPKVPQKRSYSSASFAAATGGNRRPTAAGFGVYSDPTTGTQVFNPGTSSERVLYGPTNLKSASPTNINIGFKPRGLKWNGKDAVTASQLQQMRANKKNKVAATSEISK